MSIQAPGTAVAFSSSVTLYAKQAIKGRVRSYEGNNVRVEDCRRRAPGVGGIPAWRTGRFHDRETGRGRPDGGCDLGDGADGPRSGDRRAVDARGIATITPEPCYRIKGARITERINLAYSTICHSARFLSCFFEQAPGLYWARCQQMSFKGSHLPGLSASNVHMDGHLRLDGCVATGLLELRGAQLAGSLTMNRARIFTLGMAIDCDRIQTGRGLAAKGLHATGQVRLSSARVIGTMILDEARLTDTGGLPLDLDGLVADGNVFCRGMAVTGMVSLRNARVTGSLSFTGTTIDHPGRMAFRGSRITAEGGLYLGDGFIATGTVRLADSRIDRELSLKVPA